MADESNSGAVSAPAPVADAQATQMTTAQVANEESAQPSKDEWVQFRKDIRELKGLLKDPNKGRTSQEPASEPAKAKPATDAQASTGAGDAVTARMDALERNLALERAFNQSQITDVKSQDLIRRAFQSENASDIPALVAEYAPSIKPVTVAAPVTTTRTAPTQVPNVSNTGAPSATQPVLSFNPNEIDPQVFKSMTPEEQQKRVKEWLGSSNRSNPHRGARHKK